MKQSGSFKGSRRGGGSARAGTSLYLKQKASKLLLRRRNAALTCVYAGVGGRDAELRLDELGDERDEGGDDGALRGVGQADEEEGHVAEDPQRRLGKIWRPTQDGARLAREQM